MHLTVLIGTVHGNATSVAQTLQLIAPDHDITMDLLPMDGLDISVFDRPGTFLLCTSTTGSGDVPDNAQALYHALDAQAKYLGHVRYGLIALGDSSYGDSFYGGGKRFDERLQDLGAQRVGDICVLDASSGDDAAETATTWFSNWVNTLTQDS
jgi:MioC protein